MPAWAMWFASILLLVVRALIAAAESAFYGTSDLRAKELSASAGTSGQRLLRHKLERESTAATLRLGMVLSGFLAAALGALAPPQVFHTLARGDADWVWILPPIGGALLSGLVAAVLDVLFRAVAIARPESWALRLSGLVSLLKLTLFPIIWLMVAILNVAGRPFGARVKFEAPPPPLEELEKLLTAQAANNAEIDKGAPQLIRSIFELSDKRCQDVMVPRVDVVAVDITTPPREILRILAEENHSRIPVYKDDPDQIVGILHARDLIPLLQHPDLIVLADTIRPAHFVPWVKPIGDLLREMQAKRIHMASVVDEYGGFMGVVTLEDILREIVGDIRDEFEEEERLVEKQPDGSYLVSAAMPAGDFQKTFGMVLPEGDFDTVGGFLSSLAGTIPEVGERFAYEGFQFVVHDKIGPRLDRIRVTKPRTGAGLPAGATATAGATPVTSAPASGTAPAASRTEDGPAPPATPRTR